MPEPKMIYFAGKVSKGGGYRGKLLGNTLAMSLGLERYKINGGEVIYCGPSAIACDHGCYHFNSPHGALWTGDANCSNGWMEDDPLDDDSTPHDLSENPEMVVRRCFRQIEMSDGVHCYIDTISCYGTLVELGYARSLAKPIRIFVSRTIPKRQKRELWFVLNMPGDVRVEEGDETSFSSDFLSPAKSFKERYREYLQSEDWNRKRLSKLQEAGYRCQLCNRQDALNVHHRTYDRVFIELPEDLIALCSKCHEKFHNISSKVA